MQAGKNATEKVKETTANLAATAKSGLEKTKATVQEKVEKMTSQSPAEKEMARERKEARMNEAEWNKQEARENNAAAREAERARGVAGQAGGYDPKYTSAEPGQLTGQYGHVTEGRAGTHPVGTNTGTGTTTARNPSSGCTTQTRYETGDGYN